jgi:hypothetical protein
MPTSRRIAPASKPAEQSSLLPEKSLAKSNGERLTGIERDGLLKILRANVKTAEAAILGRATKLSTRPIRRQIHLQIQIGPFYTPSVPLKANRPYPSEQYVVWSGELPGKRFCAVLQKVNRLQAVNDETGELGNLADQIHNPILFRKIVHAKHLKADPSWAGKAIEQATAKAQGLVKDLAPKSVALRVRADAASDWATLDATGGIV